jgi:hypothetical protein
MKKKDIIKLIKESINEIGADAYGSATNMTKGLNVAKSRFTKTGRPPGVWEHENKEIEDLEKRIAQKYRDQEQTAEPEGGPISSEIGAEIEALEKKLAVLKGTTPQDKPYDEVYLSSKLVNKMTDAYEYDNGRITIYPDLGSLQYKSRSTQEIVEIAFVRAFGNRPIYDELKNVFPEIPSPGSSQYSGFVNILADDGPIPVDLDTAQAMVQAMKKGKDAEAAAQSAFYTREPGRGGTGIDEQQQQQQGGGEEKKEKPEKPVIANFAKKKGGCLADCIEDWDIKKLTLEIKRLNNKKRELVKQMADAANISPNQAAQIQQTQVSMVEQIDAKKDEKENLQDQANNLRKGEEGEEQKQNENIKPIKSKKMNTKKLWEDYSKQRINDKKTLKEHMSQHEKSIKKKLLKEGVMRSFFEYFEQGMTNEEIVQLYAQRGVEVPTNFASKARGSWEKKKALQLELDMSEKTAKNDFRNIVNNAEGMNASSETKQMSSMLGGSK